MEMSLRETWLARAPRKTSCSECGALLPEPPPGEYRAFRVRGREELFEYVRSLSAETHEWLLAFYLDRELNLLAVETIARGALGSIWVDQCRIILRGRKLGAMGFILVHNHPSGIAEPSDSDIAITKRLRRLSEDYDCHLLDHFIVAGDSLVEVGIW